MQSLWGIRPNAEQLSKHTVKMRISMAAGKVCNGNDYKFGSTWRIVMNSILNISQDYVFWLIWDLIITFQKHTQIGKSLMTGLHPVQLTFHPLYLSVTTSSALSDSSVMLLCSASWDIHPNRQTRTHRREANRDPGKEKLEVCTHVRPLCDGLMKLYYILRAFACLSIHTYMHSSCIFKYILYFRRFEMLKAGCTLLNSIYSRVWKVEVRVWLPGGKMWVEKDFLGSILKKA